MDKSSTTPATLDEADEEILTFKVSDEALEAAAPGPIASVRCNTISDTVCLSCFDGCKVIV
jgi:hypothetical protein